MKKIVALSIFLAAVSSGVVAQKADTVSVDLARTSRIVFTIEDKTELEQLKRYDFGALFADIISKLEQGDALEITASDSSPEKATVVIRKEENTQNEKEEWEFHCSDDHRGVFSTFNFEFGINNWLENGSFPDYNNAQYTVRPWGSWYVGLFTILHTDISRSMFVEWGFGVSWYNLKFQDHSTILTKTDTETIFTQDPRDFHYIKSKLTASYLNVSIIPMFALGKTARPGWRQRGIDAFRIGIGPYAGYRLGSYSKLVYSNGGDREKEKERSNYYLNNFRYGLKLQFGTRGIEFFCAYDLNPMFAKDRGPDLNALTFGLIF